MALPGDRTIGRPNWALRVSAPVVLKRLSSSKDGIFGKIQLTPDLTFHTLEHAFYRAEGPHFTPKVPVGPYVCQKGLHKLRGGIDFFETFEICHVPAATQILFHVGNFQSDSSGCVLLGMNMIVSTKGSPMLMRSRFAFDLFMAHFRGQDQFQLLVRE